MRNRKEEIKSKGFNIATYDRDANQIQQNGYRPPQILIKLEWVLKRLMTQFFI